MSAELITVQLKDIADLKGGYAFKSKEYTDDGMFVLRTVNINDDGSISRSGATFVSLDAAVQYERFRLREWDTLFVMVGATLGKTGLVKSDDLPALLNQNMWVIRATSDIVNPRYLHYIFRHNSKELLRFASGAARDFLRRDDFRNMELSLPPRKTQDNITNLVGSIDDKIQLNHQINQTLEQMAQAIFKSWFVDFEPVKAKIAALDADGTDEDALLAAMQIISGKDADQLAQMQAEQPEQYAELRATAELFPSAMQDSELGEIPDGWEFSALRDQTTALRGFSYKGKGLADTGIPMHNLNSVLEGGGYKYTGIKYYSLEYKPKFEVQPGDVLVANTEQGHDHLLIGYGTRVPHFFEQGFFSHHLYRIRPNQGSNISEEFLSCLFRHEHFVQQVQGFTNGTTVNMLPMAGVEMPRFVCPTKQLAQAFSALVKPLFIQAEKNYLQGRELSELRDALLPKLLSGELALPDTEEPQPELQDVAHV